jgi:hypothetical protein
LKKKFHFNRQGVFKCLKKEKKLLLNRGMSTTEKKYTLKLCVKNGYFMKLNELFNRKKAFYKIFLYFFSKGSLYGKFLQNYIFKPNPCWGVWCLKLSDRKPHVLNAFLFETINSLPWQKLFG